VPSVDFTIEDYFGRIPLVNISDHPAKTGSTKSSWLGRLWLLTRTNPADAVTAVALISAAVLTVLSLFDVVALGAKVLANVAVFVACSWLVGSVVDREKRRNLADRRRIESTEVREELAKLNISVRQLGDSLERISDPSQVKEIAPKEVGAWLQMLLSGSKTWTFRGGSGRWQRSDVLPTLARETTLPPQYVMQILDLRQRGLCERYANYRARSRVPATVRPDEDSPETVLYDLLACVYAAGWYGHRTRVVPEVYLIPFYSPLRIDASDSGLAVTVADPDRPGLFAPRDGWYCKALLDEIGRAGSEFPRVTLPEVDDAFPKDWHNVDATHIETFLSLATITSPFAPTEPLWGQASDWGAVDLVSVAHRAFAGRKND
jgi:hypothetical protein